MTGMETGLLGLARARFARHRLAVASALALALLSLLAAAAPLVEAALGVDGEVVDLFNRFAEPSAAHPLGTDELGRDFLVRLFRGGQVSLLVGLTAALAAAVMGTIVGLTAGYFGGRLDALLMRFTDAVISLPFLPLLIVLAAVDVEKVGLPADLVASENISLYRIVAIIAMVGWTTVARLVRASALSLREREFVLAAHAQGAGALRVMGIHILPNLVSPIIVATTLSVGNVILL